jgi:hypothetical protein
MSRLATRRTAKTVGWFLVAAGAVVCFGSLELGVQGAYHDEIYQAPAAFAWAGEPAWHFSWFRVRGYPLFTMPYAGALKPAIYGLYLRATGDYWSLRRWRLYGLLLAGSGFGILAATAARHLATPAAAALLVLCVTDATAIISARHDGSSNGMGLLLRCLLLATWLATGGRSRRAALAMGLWAGLAAYDKLHTLALVPVVAILLAGGERRDYLRRGLAASAGFFLGVAPVVWAHLEAWLSQGVLWSLQGRPIGMGPQFRSIGSYLLAVTDLGVPRQVHGIRLPAVQSHAERAGFIGSMVLAAAFSIWRRQSRYWLPLVAWAVMVVALISLPVPTRGLHWLALTPLAYVAVAQLLDRPDPASGRPAGVDRRWRLALCAVLALWFVARAATLSTVAGILLGRTWAESQNPNLSEFARFAARRHAGDAFLVGQWGIGNSMFCEFQGHGERIFEAGYWPPEMLREWLAARKTPFYVVGLKPPYWVEHRERTDRLLAAVRAAPGWAERRADDGLNAFPPVEVWRFDPVGDP